MTFKDKLKELESRLEGDDKKLLSKVLFVLETLPNNDEILDGHENEIKLQQQKHEEQFENLKPLMDAYYNFNNNFTNTTKEAPPLLYTIEQLENISILVGKGKDFQTMIDDINKYPSVKKQWDNFLIFWKMNIQ